MADEPLGPPVPPNTPDGPGQQSDSPMDGLRRFLMEELLPVLQQQQEEIIQARLEVIDNRLIEIRTWVSQQITPLTPQALARQVGDILGPELNAQFIQGVKPIAESAISLGQRLSVLEERPSKPSITAVATTTPEGSSDRITGFAALADTLIDMVGEKILPMINQFQTMRQTNKLFSMDPIAIEAFRKANPAYSMILANQLAPDQNMMGLLNQLPFITANAIGVGMKARVMAPQLVAGGAAWPGTLGLGLPGFSPSTPGGQSSAPTTPRTGASMQQARQRLGRPGSRSNALSRIMRTNGAKPQVPGKLTDLIR